MRKARALVLLALVALACVTACGETIGSVCDLNDACAPPQDASGDAPDAGSG